MNTTKIGIIGVGQIGKHHLTRYRDIPGIEVIAACDVDEANLDAVCSEFDISARYTDFRKLVERDDIVAVDVCLHNNFHAPVTIAALRAGKHVYCEKPIAGSYTDGRRMVEEARKLGKMLHVQLSTLYAKETKAAKIIIDGGKLGKIYHMRSTGYRCRGRPFVDGYGTANFVKKDVCGGGALFDMGVYHIARMLHLVGNPKVLSVSGQTYQETEIDPVRKQLSGYDVEELALGFVRMSKGITMDVIEAWAVHLNEFEGSSILGSQGGIRLSPLSYHSTFCDLEMNSTFNLEAMEFRRHKLRENEDAYDSSQHHWAAALGGRAELLPTAEIALNTMLVQEGIYLSSSLGHEVTAEEVATASRSTAAKL